MFDSVLQLLFDLPIRLAAHRQNGASAGPKEAGDDRRFITDHVVEQESGVCLIHQRRDVPNVYGLPNVGKLALPPQSVQEVAEVLFHVLSCAHSDDTPPPKLGGESSRTAKREPARNASAIARSLKE